MRQKRSFVTRLDRVIGTCIIVGSSSTEKIEVEIINSPCPSLPPWPMTVQKSQLQVGAIMAFHFGLLAVLRTTSCLTSGSAQSLLLALLEISAFDAQCSPKRGTIHVKAELLLDFLINIPLQAQPHRVFSSKHFNSRHLLQSTFTGDSRFCGILLSGYGRVATQLSTLR